jgi:hypothetical protein
VSALDDTEPRTGMSGSWDNTPYADPRICDMAALVLSKLWPQKYVFHWSLLWGDCDPQLIGLKNLWRKEHGLPLLSLPPAPAIPEADETKLNPHLEKLANASDTAMSGAEIAAVENEFGLSAIPAVRHRLEKVQATATGANALQELARRLGNHVREVRTERDLDAKTQQELDEFTGTSLTAESLQKLLIFLSKNLPVGTTGFTFNAERPGNDTGFLVNLAWIPGNAAPGASGWSTSESVILGDKNIHGSSGSRSNENAQTPDGYQDLRKSVAQALASQPDVAIAIHFRAELD